MACGGNADAAKRITPVTTRQGSLSSAHDANGDGRPTRELLDAPVRFASKSTRTKTASLDRWEYYGRIKARESGSSRANDGKEDPVYADPTDRSRICVSTRRDGK
jgi:hypothetical protein